MLEKNLLMLVAVRMSSFGSTWEVWRALKKLELLSAVVRKMGSLAQSSYFQNNISTTNKIPDYAKGFEKEWLFIRGINTTLENFVCEYLSDASELFVSSYSDRIKYYIRRFLKGQERGYLKEY